MTAEEAEARIAELEAAAVLLRERMQIACNSSALDRDARIWGAAIRMLDASFALPPREGGAS
jgi:hypothetical protein